MSAVDFGCRWSISIVDGRLTEKSTVGGRLKKKKGKEERRSTSPLSSPARCSRALAARGLPARRCRPRATIVPVRGNKTSLCAGRETEATYPKFQYRTREWIAFFMCRFWFLNS
ncbi:hypothetical protein BHE74_00051688 [Ensete ventricosum]|nr:hypothetical protein BHE74_00051688 [Ensete ventricosum]